MSPNLPSHARPDLTPKEATELAKLGSGQPIDMVKLHEEMESDKMDRLIAGAKGGGGEPEKEEVKPDE